MAAAPPGEAAWLERWGPGEAMLLRVEAWDTLRELAGRSRALTGALCSTCRASDYGNGCALQLPFATIETFVKG